MNSHLFSNTCISLLKKSNMLAMVDASVYRDICSGDTVP